MSSIIAPGRTTRAHFMSIMAVVLAAGCAAHEMPPPMPMPIPPQLPPEGPTTTPVPDPEPAPPQQPEPQPGVLGFSPRWGTAGAAVQLNARDFEPGTRVEIGFGVHGEEPRTIGTLTADAQGVLRGVVTVPTWAERGRVYSFVAGPAGAEPRLISEIFHIADAEGVVRVEGRLTDEGVECPALRTADDRLYTLAGDIGEFQPGDTVVVEGTLPEMSTCMQGITVSVRRIAAPGGD